MIRTSRRFFLSAVCALLAGSAFMPGCRTSHQTGNESGPITIQIIATNDIHGALASTLKPDLAGSDAEGRPGRLGGVEYLAGVIGRLRSEAPDRTLVLDAGDCFQGDYAVNASEGLFCTEFFNAVGYSARTIGNHEFDYLDVGPDSVTVDPRGALKKAVSGARHPIVLANVHQSDGSNISDVFKEFAVIDVHGVNVGITGVLTPTTPSVSRKMGSRDLVFENPATALNRVVPAMRTAGADIVVVLAHLTGSCTRGSDLYPSGYGNPCSTNGELAALAFGFNSGTIDLIVSGHDHVFLRGDGRRVPVMENPGQGMFAGLAEIEFDRTARQVKAVRVRDHVPICPSENPGSKVCDRSWPGFTGAAPVDPVVDGLKARAQQAVAAECSDVVATAPEPILFSSVTEPPVSNLAADLLRDLGTESAPAGVDRLSVFSLINRGSTRGSLAAGAISVCEAARVWPFEDAPVMVALSGTELLKIMEYLVDVERKPPAISGFRASREGTGPVVLRTADGTLIEPDKVYYLVTTGYMIEGGNGLDRFFGALPAERFTRLPYSTYRDGFIQLMRKRGKVTAPGDERYSGIVRDQG